MPIGLIALGFLRGKAHGVAPSGRSCRLASLGGLLSSLSSLSFRLASLGGRSSPDGGVAVGTGLASLGGILGI